MGVSTIGKIKGFIGPSDIIDYVKKMYGGVAEYSIERHNVCSLEELGLKYVVNEHSDDKDNWYSISGHIKFWHNGELVTLFYSYDNINIIEDEDMYVARGLKDMLLSETTYIDTIFDEGSIEIVKDIVTHFGGGWINENDYKDDMDFYAIEGKEDTVDAR